MSNLDDYLRDPRVHRAVADPEMSARVAERALAEFRPELSARQGLGALRQRRGGTRVTRAQATALLMKWLPTPRWTRVSLALACVATLSLAAFWIAMQAGVLPRFDIHLKYSLREWSYSLATMVGHAPMLTASFLATATCALGFALSSRARAGATAFLRA